MIDEVGRRQQQKHLWIGRYQRSSHPPRVLVIKSVFELINLPNSSTYLTHHSIMVDAKQ